MAGSQVEVALTQIEKQRLGYQAISLTNYDNDSEPQIAAGSKVEIAGALFEFPTLESITGWAGIGVSNDVYIKLVVSGTSVTAEFTTTAPTWSTSKQGWYGTGGEALHRYIGGLYKDASGNYSYKWLYADRPAEKGGNSYDVGSITPYVVKSIPGYLWCNGATTSNISNPEYTRLIYLLKKEAGADAAHPYYHADSDKAVLPDLRGAVIRGVDIAANRDKDGVRKSGDYQADDNKTHAHNAYRYDTATGGLRAINSIPDTAATRTSLSGAVLSTGATEATVKNIALYYLVKY